MVDPALSVLGKVLKKPLKRGDTSTVARSAFGILDRAGFAPGRGPGEPSETPLEIARQVHEAVAAMRAMMTHPTG